VQTGTSSFRVCHRCKTRYCWADEPWIKTPEVESIRVWGMIESYDEVEPFFWPKPPPSWRERLARAVSNWITGRRKRSDSDEAPF
jgi:hypothetical protein